MIWRKIDLVKRVTDSIQRQKPANPYAHLTDKQRKAVERYATTATPMQRFASALDTDALLAEVGLPATASVEECRIAYEAELQRLNSYLSARKKFAKLTEGLKDDPV